LSLKQLGLGLDLVATVRRDPKQEHIDAVEAVVERLVDCKKREEHYYRVSRSSHFRSGVGGHFRIVPLTGEYEAVLLESEYCEPVLDNGRLRV